MSIVILVAASEDRFKQIVLELEPTTRKWAVLRGTIFVNVPLGVTILWSHNSPILVNRETIVILGVGETGGDFETYQKWRHLLAKDFEQVTHLTVTAA